MIITIDGPTASGKSTVARLVAEQLGYTYINSGLLFRALAYVLMKKIAPDQSQKPSIELFERALTEDHAFLDVHSLEKLCAPLTYHFEAGKGSEVYHYDEPITHFLKSPEIDQAASIIGTHASVRQVLLDFQRALANNYDVVADGRDCGTVVFPHADFKFFLTASVAVRAQRLGHALNSTSSHLSFEELKKAVEERDARDSQRILAPLKPAPDCFIIDSSSMTVQEVISEMIDIVGS